jgi:hypothetical protein
LTSVVAVLQLLLRDLLLRDRLLRPLTNMLGPLARVSGFIRHALTFEQDRSLLVRFDRPLVSGNLTSVYVDRTMRATLSRRLAASGSTSAF